MSYENFPPYLRDSEGGTCAFALVYLTKLKSRTLYQISREKGKRKVSRMRAFTVGHRQQELRPRNVPTLGCCASPPRSRACPDVSPGCEQPGGAPLEVAPENVAEPGLSVPWHSLPSSIFSLKLFRRCKSQPNSRIIGHVSM